MSAPAIETTMPALTDALTDAELMRRVRDGDSDAFAVLVDRHASGLVAYLSVMTGQPERAEDLAQEAFLKAYASADLYVEHGKFSAWLYRIATNLVRSEARRRRRWLARVDHVRAMLSWSSPRGPDARVQGGQEQVVVRRALDRLPEDFRAAIVLREIEGWSYHEIATALGMPEATARTRVHRAKALLRSELASVWQEGDDA